MRNACHYRTFSLHLKKKLSGSLPYEMADPIIGIQWNTSGGNEGSRGTIFTQHVSWWTRDWQSLDTHQLPEDIQDDGENGCVHDCK